ncbi:MAG: fatty acid kinase [Acidobacteriota bacterium]|nr:fatty acid kinase [Acidobacteriota bacterium]
MNKVKKFPLNKIRYLDGARLRRAILAGISHLEQYQDYLNKINVFPVPDGDTGTNMFLTMRQVSCALVGVPNKSIAIVSSQVAEGALTGAQGNSGAILAQFFHGFAEGARGKWQLTTRAFANAVQTAHQASRSALANPKDGTILSVINDWADYVHKTAQKTEDFVVLLKNSLIKARESLAETQKKLEVLKKAGVVDAGAQGFVHLLEGIVNFIDRGKIKRIVDRFSSEKPAAQPVQVKEIISGVNFRYCTECIVNGKLIDHLQIKTRLMDVGDSLIVAGGAKRIRVHIHTDSPDTVFDILASYGEISAQKIDDMMRQQQEAFPSSGISDSAGVERIAIVTDSSCDIPHHLITQHHIQMIPLKLIFGTQTFLDKVQISPGEFYEKLTTVEEHPKTSQPASEDIKQIYDSLIPKYDRILSIHLPRVVSGTFQAIEHAARKYEGDKIICIDGKNISCALGLAVLEAAAAIQEGLPLDKVIQRTQEAVDNIHIFIILPTLKYVVKGGRLSKPKGFIGKILHLNPVVSIDREGHVVIAAKAIGEKNALAKSLKMALKKARQYKEIKLMVAHVNAYSKAEKLAAELSGLFDISGEIPILEAAPVLGVHGGPGTVGFAFIGYK